VPYDPLKDFIPVSQLVRGYIVLIASPRYPANDIKSVITLARDNQGLTSFGSSGSGTTSRLVGEMLNIETKADLLHVPYRGASAARNDVVMRQVDLAFDDLGPALDAAKAGRIKMIALASSNRSKIAPNLPTISETFPGISADPMIGVWVRSGTPAAAVERLARELAAVVRDPAVAKILTEQTYEPVGSSPQEFGIEVNAAQEKYRRIVKAAGVELD
jgi:tripartite-type tricarboxylate transporter receptor subunit TctC